MPQTGSIAVEGRSFKGRDDRVDADAAYRITAA
jgi:hypothetical protein